MMRRVLETLRSLRRCRRGATAIEFAMLAPVFLIMVLGMFEVGRAMWIKSALQFGVEEAARFAMANPTASMASLTTLALSRAPVPDLAAANFNATSASIGGTTYVTITGSYNFTVVVPLVPLPAVVLNARSYVPVS